jgi:hypothetical protein
MHITDPGDAHHQIREMHINGSGDAHPSIRRIHRTIHAIPIRVDPDPHIPRVLPPPMSDPHWIVHPISPTIEVSCSPRPC